MCAPRFHSAAFFAALRGTPDNGRWLVAPVAPKGQATRRYRGDTLILETEFDADGGTVRLIDFMAERDECCRVVRVVEGVRGRVAMQMHLTLRFDYGNVVPWMERQDDGSRRAIAGPDAVTLYAPIDLRG